MQTITNAAEGALIALIALITRNNLNNLINLITPTTPIIQITPRAAWAQKAGAFWGSGLMLEKSV